MDDWCALHSCSYLAHAGKLYVESLFFDVVPAVKMAPKLHEVEIDLKTFQILGPYRGKMIRHSSDIADTIITEWVQNIYTYGNADRWACLLGQHVIRSCCVTMIANYQAYGVSDATLVSKSDINMISPSEW
jgi:hypothetical protein